MSSFVLRPALFCTLLSQKICISGTNGALSASTEGRAPNNETRQTYTTLTMARKVAIILQVLSGQVVGELSVSRVRKTDITTEEPNLPPSAISTSADAIDDLGGCSVPIFNAVRFEDSPNADSAVSSMPHRMTT